MGGITSKTQVIHLEMNGAEEIDRENFFPTETVSLGVMTVVPGGNLIGCLLFLAGAFGERVKWEFHMSTRMFAAVMGMGAAICLAAPVEAARLDNGPVASLYENDGRHKVSRRAAKSRSARRTSSSRRQRASSYRRKGYRSSSQRKAYRSSGRKAVASRAATAGRSGGGASRGCLTAAARGLLNRIEAQFGTVQLVSTCRPGATIRNTGRPSRHASGNAIDFNAGGRKGAIVSWLRANHHNGGTMTYANMSHIHVDIGPRFVKLNFGGRRG